MKQRRYSIELGLALALYLVLLVVSLTVTLKVHPTGSTQIALALLPMLGVAAGVWAIIRQHQRMDELQRRIQFEALSIAFAGTAFGTLTWGFLENAGLPRLPTFGVWPIMGALWCIGLLIARRRYR